LKGKEDKFNFLPINKKNPKASIAIAKAIVINLVSLKVSCHRVIQSTGIFGGYMWGNTRKTAIIGWEGAKTHSEFI
jgi:AraC family transcriptional regulator of adaptative response/methylated-DNA-[protein]-cysteine methyltransferase